MLLNATQMGSVQRSERFGNSFDRCKLMKPGLDHQSHTLGIGGWQRAAPLTLDDFEHIRIAHAAEALDENFFGDRISAGRQHLGVGSGDDRLAVDQHPIAVENDQLKSAGNHPSRSTETLTPSASRSIRPPSSLVLCGGRGAHPVLLWQLLRHPKQSLAATSEAVIPSSLHSTTRL